MKRKESAATNALYAYLIGRTADLQKTLTGGQPDPIEKGSEIRIIDEGGIAALVSPVSLDSYGEGRFEERLRDPAWAAEKVMRHQAIAEFFSLEHSVVPLRFGVLYSTADKVQEMLKERRDMLNQALQRLEGCEEWGVNVYVEKPTLMGRLDELSPKLAELKARVEQATPGQAYLLEKQADRLRASELKIYMREVVDVIAQSLESQVEGSKRIPVGETEARQEPAVAAKLVYLVQRPKLRSFRTAAEKAAQQHADAGVRLELTGPWPPYNFVE